MSIFHTFFDISQKTEEQSAGVKENEKMRPAALIDDLHLKSVHSGRAILYNIQ